MNKLRQKSKTIAYFLLSIMMTVMLMGLGSTGLEMITRNTAHELPPIIMDDMNTKQILKDIRDLKPGDTYTIYGYSFGGDVMSGMEVYNAMKETKGKIVYDIQSGAFSMGAIWALGATEVKGHDMSILLFHVGRYGDGSVPPKGQDAILDYMDDFERQIMSPYFTKEELDKVFNEGRDLVITVKDFNCRKKGIMDTPVYFGPAHYQNTIIVIPTGKCKSHQTCVNPVFDQNGNVIHKF